MDLTEVSDIKGRHPWEISRAECIIKEIQKLGLRKSVLDIGCGDGYFDKRLLEKFPKIDSLYGLDIYLENPYDEGKGHYVNSLESLPDRKFDLILMMDVLEHIKDDKAYIQTVKELLDDNGVIVLTVPAFMKLYSLHDRELKHFRRYDRHMLKKAFEGSGLKIKNMSYFYLSLVFMRLLTMNKTENLSMWNSSEKSFKTVFVKTVLNIDYAVLRFFSRFHIYIGGLSLLAIIEKDGRSNE